MAKAGRFAAEIASELGISTRTVERRLEEVREAAVSAEAKQLAS
jgi:DNA-directed RNA polymerase specialized sigma24 family protein